jgi:hypothetical protein
MRERGSGAVGGLAAATLLAGLISAQTVSPSRTGAVPAARSPLSTTAPTTAAAPAATTPGTATPVAPLPTTPVPGPTRTPGRTASAVPVVPPVLSTVPTTRAPQAPSPSASPTVDPIDAQATALLVKPALSRPINLRLVTTQSVYQLDPARDYAITITGASFTKPVSLEGGRNVVIEDQVLRYRKPTVAEPGWTVRGLLLKGATGVTWVSGLQIRGPLAEGIDLDQREPGAAVVLRDIAIDPVSGSQDTNHADLLQTWAGPDKLVVDGFSGRSNYQGMFLRPTDLWDGPWPTFFSLRHVSIDVTNGYYALYTDGHDAFPIHVLDVAVKPHTANRNAWLWPKPSTGDTTWAEVTDALL